MTRYQNQQDSATRSKALPPIQVYFLLIILLGYPLVSFGFNLLGSTDPGEITSKIGQVYLPAMLVQVIIFGALWNVLRRSGGRFSDIGLARDDINWSNALSGLIFFVGAWALIIIIKSSIERAGYIPGKEFFHLLPSTAVEKGFWVFLSAGAALAEETCFRGYVISRVKILSGSYWAGAILGSAAFSLGHLYQGLAGVILTFVYGMLFSGLYVARKSVFPCIIAHFLQDAIVLLAVFIIL